MGKTDIDAETILVPHYKYGAKPGDASRGWPMAGMLAPPVALGRGES